MGKIFCIEFQKYPLKFHTKISCAYTERLELIQNCSQMLELLSIFFNASLLFRMTQFIPQSAGLHDQYGGVRTQKNKNKKKSIVFCFIHEKNIMRQGCTSWVRLGGCYTNMSRALKICVLPIVLLIRISSLNFVRVPKGMLWAHVQKFQLAILSVNVISGIVYFREIILESSQKHQ